MSVDFCLMGNYRGIRDSLGSIKPLHHKYPAIKEEIGGGGGTSLRLSFSSGKNLDVCKNFQQYIYLVYISIPSRDTKGYHIPLPIVPRDCCFFVFLGGEKFHDPLDFFNGPYLPETNSFPLKASENQWLGKSNVSFGLFGAQVGLVSEAKWLLVLGSPEKEATNDQAS